MVNRMPPRQEGRLRPVAIEEVLPHRRAPEQPATVWRTIWRISTLGSRKSKSRRSLQAEVHRGKPTTVLVVAALAVVAFGASGCANDSSHPPGIEQLAVDLSANYASGSYATSAAWVSTTLCNADIALFGNSCIARGPLRRHPVYALIVSGRFIFHPIVIGIQNSRRNRDTDAANQLILVVEQGSYHVWNGSLGYSESIGLASLGKVDRASLAGIEPVSYEVFKRRYDRDERS